MKGWSDLPAGHPTRTSHCPASTLLPRTFLVSPKSEHGGFQFLQGLRVPPDGCRRREDKPQGRSRTDLRGPSSPSTAACQAPEVALTLDNSQHGMGPVQGDGQAQRPQVPLLLEQVVQFLLPGGGREERATWLGLELKAEP